MNKFGIKGKLIFAFLGASLLPLGVTSYYSYWKAKDSLEKAAVEQVESIRKSTKSSLDTYFKNVESQLTTLAHQDGIINAMNDFSKGFESYAQDAKLTQVDTLVAKRKLSDYYKNEFGAEYIKQNDGKSADIQKTLSDLSDSQVIMQSIYIAENENPLGSKHKLDSDGSTTSYNKVHAIHHPNLREYLEKFGYYDIFLIDANSGNVVYSVFKELDFATSLKNGPYAETSLGKAFRQALLLPEGNDVIMTDYEKYFPSYNAPAGFFATPIYREGKLIGVMAFQISFDEINKITLQQNTKYPTLETFLVGGDSLMRSNARADQENLSVKASFKNPVKGSIKSASIALALKGEEQTTLGTDYLNRDVITSFAPLDLFGIRWVINTNVTIEDALAPVVVMRWALLIGSLIAAFAVVTVALWYARALANKLTQVAEGLRSGSGIVATTSQQIAEVSTRLSEASTEQAASLQETVASIDEISAMVQRNADSAGSSSRTSEASTVAAQRGKEKVEMMLDSIHEISKGNEEIMSSIQKSNQEISEIVRVIQAIADKTKVINDIVFQTKLLSFNASVEAARAGEHGKGFAVVAEEVGNLASMSGKAATEITDMLDKSVHRVTQIVDGTKIMMDSLVKTSKDKVDFGTKTAKECAGALDEIMKNVSSVNELVREISTASQEQSTGVREITKAMAELDQVTQQNTASSNDASHTARELKDQAERLNTFVNELAHIVHGDKSVAKVDHSSSDKHSDSSEKVVSIGKFRPSKSPASSLKKVVGLEFETPKSDDSRFEDV